MNSARNKADVNSAQRRLIESDHFPFEFVSRLAEMESWRKEVHRPIYHIHKWWAKRLGSVFRAILLGSVLPETADLGDAFYRKHDFAGLTVFDPFMGSGTTIGEGPQAGFHSTGPGHQSSGLRVRARRPWPVESGRAAAGPLASLPPAWVGGLALSIERWTANLISAMCSTSFGSRRYCARPAPSGWICSLPTFSRGTPILNASRRYASAARAAAAFLPPKSGTPMLAVLVAATASISKKVQPAELVQPAGVVITPSPSPETIKALGHPPDHRLFAKLVLTASGGKVYLPATAEDKLAYHRCSEELAQNDIPLPTLKLEDGYNTRQALNYAYRSWREFFNDRQLLALGWLHQAILELPDDVVRAAMLTAFSGALEFNNMFASYKGEGTGAIRHMFAHHILKPERLPVEGHVWGTPKSSGSFSTLFKSRLFRAIDYRNAPFEVFIPDAIGGKGGKRAYGASPPFTGRVSTLWPPPEKAGGRTICLSCGSSATTGLPANSVDLIVTDPPFFDNVHYSELADFFFAWQKLEPSPFTDNRRSTRHPEEVQDANSQRFENETARRVHRVPPCFEARRASGVFVSSLAIRRLDFPGRSGRRRRFFIGELPSG